MSILRTVLTDIARTNIPSSVSVNSVPLENLIEEAGRYGSTYISQLSDRRWWARTQLQCPINGMSGRMESELHVELRTAVEELVHRLRNLETS